MMADELLNAQDLITAKKHDTFHSEVITGKAGGLSTGADIDYATNAVTGQVQKTLPATVNGIDWTPVGNLTTDNCTFTKSTDYAVDDSGTQWAYNGTFPFTSTAPVVPSAPDYYVVHVRDHNSTSDRNAVGAHDSIYPRKTTVAEIQSSVFVPTVENPVIYLTVTDRGNAPFNAVLGGTPNGFDVLDAGNGNTATLSKTEAAKGIHGAWFGVKTNDFASAESNYLAIRAMQTYAANNFKDGDFSSPLGGINIEFQCNVPLLFDTGVIYVAGNSPFHIPASDYAGVGDKKFGIMFKGSGIESTVFELTKPDGYVGTIWFYDNMAEQDGSSGLGGWSNITFEDMTLRTSYWVTNNPSSMAKRASNDYYNGFRKESGGFEKFFKFNRVLFTGFDFLDACYGTSNTDENHYTNCRIGLIREQVLRLENPESVIHRFDSCDFEVLLGSLCNAREGGHVTINGGSIILYPEFDINGPVARADKAAIFKIEPNVSNINARSGVYTAIDVSVEKYDINTEFARVVQIGTVVDVGDDTLVPRYPASFVDINFVRCSFATDTKLPSDSVNTTGNHDVVTINGDVLCFVTFTDCAHNTRHFYSHVNNNTEYGQGSAIRFVRPRLLWDPSKNNTVSGSWEGGTLAARCSNGNGDIEISCEGATSITTPKWLNARRNFALDFVLAGNGVRTPIISDKVAYIKRAGEATTTSSESYALLGNSLALFNGAEVLGFEIYVPAVAGIDTGDIRIHSEELTSADPNSFLLLHTESVTLSAGKNVRVDLPIASRYTITNNYRLHVKWGNFSNPVLPVGSFVKVIYR